MFATRARCLGLVSLMIIFSCSIVTSASAYWDYTTGPCADESKIERLIYDALERCQFVNVECYEDKERLCAQFIWIKKRCGPLTPLMNDHLREINDSVSQDHLKCRP